MTTEWSRRSVVAGLASIPLIGPALAQTPSGKPIKIGQSLSLTGPFGQTGLIHKIVSEIFVDQLNAKGGLLGRPVEYVLLDDQSKADIARTLYERLLTSDKVDLILAPYGTAAILAAMGVAQRNKKIFIQNTMGTPDLATYEWHFAALVTGPKPEQSLPTILMDAMDSTAHPPKSVSIVTLKFPSTQFMTSGAQLIFPKRGVNIALSLEYDFGTRDFGPIASRVRDANADMLFMSCLGIDGAQLLAALAHLDYHPPRHFYLYPSPSLAESAGAEGALGITNFDDAPPYTSNPVGAAFAKAYDERARAAGLPYPFVETQAGQEYAGWQILTAAVNATQSLDDAKLANWLDHNEVDTIVAKRDFSGAHHTAPRDFTQLKQVQKGKWVSVWPTDRASPGFKLEAP